MHVPREALIRGGSGDPGCPVALGAMGAIRSQQPVGNTGIESGDRVAIRRWPVCRPRGRVVTSGQFLIDSESNIGAALERMNNSADADSNSDTMDHSGHDMEPKQ